ncbi:hypothetical protein P8452_07248 [Trifolium repens]|nr:hypothetical protein P8452_07248 [Trifolium repens]
MKKIKQVKKSKDLQQLSSFSIGLTPSDEDKRNDIDSSSGGDENQKRKTGDAKDNEKNKHNVANKITQQEQKEKVVLTTSFNKHPVIDQVQVKNTLSTWRQMKTQQVTNSYQCLRENARLDIEKIKNTARLNENMDSMHDFDILIGVCSKR